MLKRTLLAILFCVLSVPAVAQCVGDGFLDQLSPADRNALAQAASDIPFGNGTVWTAKKGDQQVTVVGTMHVYDPRLEGIRERLKETVQRADLVLVEATQEDQKTLEQLVVTEPGILFLTEGPTLRDLVDDDTWATIAEAASSRSLPPFMAAKMQPWYLSMMLSIPPCAMQDMVSGNLGLDHMIMQDAAAAGVPTQAVEDIMTLFTIFQQDPLEEQIDLLRISLLAPDTQRQMFVSMLDSYFAGDIATLWEMSRIAVRQTPGISKEQADLYFEETEASLLVGRNRAWMPVMADALARHDDVVIAVGAAHLMGDSGVLKFLQDRGWDLSQGL
ncbi:TraB/GumN family protein [Yoonia sediminilitoris]|uniref:TraB family protein n=1 Tax=Yoonia sediminilitoris TaxID=1286148 RepID=A0A2T6KM82_9RHOB|nr:TraB/GumN family protein [Yoonia sediminilitoris]PUB17291.1 hypothetical protein C8N45_102303 [Yoonia sediminilitoris]RCW97586.1 hypothetical protein DFP92_102303 [Yoonia sediminilitoris]